jgi:hypothetical protein
VSGFVFHKTFINTVLAAVAYDTVDSEQKKKLNKLFAWDFLTQTKNKYGNFDLK